MNFDPPVDGPSLYSAKVRVNHATQRLGEIARAEAALRSTDVPPMTMRLDKAAFERGDSPRPEISWGQMPPTYRPDQVKLLASEVIHHLRTALDYLAYNLVWLDAKRPRDSERTQFPICENSARFRDECRSRLRGVTLAHRQDIRTYQPFAGCEWSGKLGELSNLDKHRFVVDIARQTSATFRVSTDTVRPDPQDDSKLLLDLRDVETSLALPTGDPAVPTLRTMCLEVGKTLLAFQTDFGESDTFSVADPGVTE